MTRGSKADTTRVLFLAQRVPAPDQAQSGAGARATVMLDALRQHFDVLPLFAAPVEPSGGDTRRWRRRVPARIRGLRQDLRFIRDDREHLRRAADAAERFRPHVVYERNEYFCRAGFRLARRLGVPLVLEVNGVLDLDMRSFYRSLGEPLGRRAERHKYRHADAIVTTSPTLADALARRGALRERIHVVPSSAPAELLRHKRHGGDGERGAGTVVVGWLGHGLGWHGLDVLADAAERVAIDFPSVIYRIVGEGPAVDRLRRHAEAATTTAKYEFTGVVDSGDVAAALGGFDIGVIPDNPADRFPVKLVAMGAAGVAVAAPPVPCITDFLRPGTDFEAFQARESDDLARALRRLVADDERRLALGRALQARVRDDFNAEAVAARLREVVDRARAARV